jgi:hypothetical protein
MQQILEELTNGSLEVVGEAGEGVLTYARRPPAALQTRTKQLILQLVNEQDGVVRAIASLEAQLASANETIFQQNININQLNQDLQNATKITSGHVQETKLAADSGNPATSNPTGEDGTT